MQTFFTIFAHLLFDYNCSTCHVLHVCLGVYLSKHADVISPESLKPRHSGILIVFKVIKVCSRNIVRCRSN